MPHPRLSASTMAAYGGPTVALSFLLFFVLFYFLKFATDVLLLPPATVGALFAVAKLWDAASNPLVGNWSDGARSSWGRRRPFLLAALPLLALTFALLWRPPASMGPHMTTLWVGVGLFGFFTAFAMYAIPHAALGAELSTDSHERTRLFGVKQISFTLGMLVAFAAIQQVMNAADPRAAAAWLALPAVLVAVIVLAITPLVIPDAARRRTHEQSLLQGLRHVWHDDAARMLLVVWFVENLGVGAVGTMAPYIAQYVLERPDIVGVLPASYVLAGVLAIPVWVSVSRRFGTRDTWMASMLLAAVSFAGMTFVDANRLPLVFVLLALAGSAMGCGSVLSSSLMADIIDRDEQRSGHRREGTYYAAMLFALKIGGSLATAGSGFLLGAVDFVPNVEQTDRSLAGMRFLFGGMPAAGYLVGAFLFRKFPLGRRLAVAPEPAPTPAA
ncbi:MAG TPA: MFS transporter [Candidatus Limnocylindrales bacterium]|nr:MFS transporter [Candidatus Limnocylindrales bacterium]